MSTIFTDKTTVLTLGGLVIGGVLGFLGGKSPDLGRDSVTPASQMHSHIGTGNKAPRSPNLSESGTKQLAGKQESSSEPKRATEAELGISNELKQSFDQRGIIITHEDVQKTMELNARAENGEFILEYERPLSRKALALTFSEAVAAKVETEGEADRSLLTKLGLDREQITKLTNHIAKIHQASLETEAGILQVTKARQKYDQQLKSMLSPDQYQEYRTYELGKPAQRELDKFKQYVLQNQSEWIHGAQEEALKELFMTEGAYTEIGWHGPFDGLPQVACGKEDTIRHLQQRVTQATEHWQQLLAMSEQQAFPEQVRTQLKNYFAEWHERKERTLTKLAAGAPQR